MHLVPRNIQGWVSAFAGAAAGWLLLRCLLSNQLASYGAAYLVGAAAICFALVAAEDMLSRRL